MEKGPKQTLGSSECFPGFRDSQPSTCHDSRIFSSQAEVHTSVCCIVSTLSCLFKIYFISLQYFFKTWLWSGAHTALPSSNPSSPTAGCVTWAQPLNRPESALSFLYREISKTPPCQEKSKSQSLRKLYGAPATGQAPCEAGTDHSKLARRTGQQEPTGGHEGGSDG